MHHFLLINVLFLDLKTAVIVANVPFFKKKKKKIKVKLFNAFFLDMLVTNVDVISF